MTNDLTPEPFLLGNRYKTVGGDIVRLVTISNEGTSFETMACEEGIHRYTQRDFGRATGTDHNTPDPRNLVCLFDITGERSSAWEG